MNELRGSPMTAPLPPLPPKQQGSSAEKIVLITVIVVWVATGLAGLGLLASSVLASGEGEDRRAAVPTKSVTVASEETVPPEAIVPPVETAQPEETIKPKETREASNDSDSISPPEDEPKEMVVRPLEVLPPISPENTGATPIAKIAPADTTSSRTLPSETTVALNIATPPAPTPAPQTLDQASVCTLSEQACIDLCPDGSVFDDGMDIGGTEEWEVCEQACRFGRIRCIKGIEEDPCGHFHGACRYHCYEESYTEDCEDSCDEGRDTCAAILGHKK
jgi:hypothetical protein